MNAVLQSIPINTLSAACARLEQAKLDEQQANQNRLSCEYEVLAIVGDLKPEGTQKFDDGHGYVATIQTSVTRKIDADKLADIADQIPEAIGKRLLRWKPELVTRELHYVQDNEPELYAIIATAIVAKPAKPSVKIERSNEVA